MQKIHFLIERKDFGLQSDFQKFKLNKKISQIIFDTIQTNCK